MKYSPVTLDPFTGEENWISLDKFDSLINQRKNLIKKDSMKGPAHTLISELTVEGKNYEVAYKS